MTAAYALPLSPRRLVVLAIGGILAYQVAMMWAWVTYPGWDWMLLRFSLSNADAIALAALAIALYSYHLYARTTESGDLQYLADFVLALRKQGLDPEKGLQDLAALMGSAANWWREHEADVRKLAPTAQAVADLAPTYLDLLPDAVDLLARVDPGKLRRSIRTAASLTDPEAGKTPPR